MLHLGIFKKYIGPHRPKWVEVTTAMDRRIMPNTIFQRCAMCGRVRGAWQI